MGPQNYLQYIYWAQLFLDYWLLHRTENRQLREMLEISASKQTDVKEKGLWTRTLRAIKTRQPFSPYPDTILLHPVSEARAAVGKLQRKERKNSERMSSCLCFNGSLLIPCQERKWHIREVSSILLVTGSQKQKPSYWITFLPHLFKQQCSLPMSLFRRWVSRPGVFRLSSQEVHLGSAQQHSMGCPCEDGEKQASIFQPHP